MLLVLLLLLLSIWAERASSTLQSYATRGRILIGEICYCHHCHYHYELAHQLTARLGDTRTSAPARRSRIATMPRPLPVTTVASASGHDTHLACAGERAGKGGKLRTALNFIYCAGNALNP
jgi:hypothetical protein